MINVLKKIGSTIYGWWMAFARALGWFNTKLLLTVFYILVVGPVWLVCLAFRVDFLDLSRRKAPTWRTKTPVEHTQEAMRRQF